MSTNSDGVTGEPEPDEDSIRFTDKRRLDPETGEVRQPQPAADEPGEPDPDNSASDLTVEDITNEANADERVTELTDDLQRVSAEYANYRKRTERDRVLIAETAQANLLLEFLPVLEDIERARAHEELTGGFKTVAESLESVAAKAGLESFGEPGDVFDPELHEAMTHTEGEGHEAPICSAIYERGYRFKDRVIRPARVAVSE